MPLKRQTTPSGRPSWSYGSEGWGFESRLGAPVMSRDTVDRCLGTSLHLCGWFGIPACDGGAVLAGVKAGALRVAFGQP